MKKIIRTNIFIAVIAIMLSVGTYFAGAYEDYGLDTIEQMHADSIGKAREKGGEQGLVDKVAELNATCLTKVPSKLIQMYVDYGAITEANTVEQLKAMGYTDVNYSKAGNKKSQSTTTQPSKTPEPFTVEPYNPAKTMWATSKVNCRAGAGTSYQKVGSLKKHEEVKVTGVASNGWYEITKEDGTKIYVSNKYLSEENPSDRVVYDVNEETGKVTTYEFKDTDPEVIDEKVAELTATPEPTVAPTEKPTPAPTAEPTIAPTAEPTPYVVKLTEEEIKQLPEETQDAIKTRRMKVLGVMAVAVVFMGIAIMAVVMNNKKKRH